jgi:hypothetical protein
VVVSAVLYPDKVPKTALPVPVTVTGTEGEVDEPVAVAKV